MRRRLSILTVVAATVAALAATLSLGGCSDGGPAGPIYKNQPPSVWITSGPPEGSEANYRIRFFWGGDDPDGEIDYYEYAITDNEGLFDPRDVADDGAWTRIDATQGSFTFTADEPIDGGPDDPIHKYGRSHTFLIRAVDNRGQRSEPAHRSFTATTLTPTAEITVPCYLGSNVPAAYPVTTFQWRAVDYIDEFGHTQPPAEVRWVVMQWWWDDMDAFIDYFRNHPAPDWSEWMPYQGGETGTHRWTAPPLGYGDYVIVVQARDEAGAVTPVLDPAGNVRRFRITPDLPSAYVEVADRLTGRTVISLRGGSQPDVFRDVLGVLDLGLQVRSFGGIACSGGKVEFRWAFDSVPGEGWSDWITLGTEWIDFGPEQPYYFGSHSLNMEIRDSSGFTGGMRITYNVVGLSFDKEVLFVDDFDEGSSAGIAATGGAMPSDAEHDAFWEDMLSAVEGFQPAADIIDVANEYVSQIPFTKIAAYKSIVWNVNGANLNDPPLLYDIIRHRWPNPVDPPDPLANMLSLYMRAGGRVLICGQEPMSLVITRDFLLNRPRFPFIFLWDLEGGVLPPTDPDPVGEKSFGYLDYAIDVLDLGFLDLQQERKDGDCAVALLRNDDLTQSTTRACVPIDPRMGRLELRPEVAGPGLFFAPGERGLLAELYDPDYFMAWCRFVPRRPRSGFEPMFGHESLNTAAPTFRAPVASWTSVHVDGPEPPSGHTRARSAVWGFEPYYFNPDQVKGALDVILFDEWAHPRAGAQSARTRE